MIALQPMITTQPALGACKIKAVMIRRKFNFYKEQPKFFNYDGSQGEFQVFFEKKQFYACIDQLYML